MLGEAAATTNAFEPELYLAQLRGRLVDAFIVIMALVSIPLVAASLMRVFSIGWMPVMYVQVAVIVIFWLGVFLRPYLSYNHRVVFLTGMLFAVGALALWNFGLISMGGPMLMVFCILTTLLSGLRAGLFAMALTAITFLLASIRFVHNPDAFAFDNNALAVSPGTWIGSTLASLLYTGLIIMALNYLYQALLLQLNEVIRRSRAQKEAEGQQRRLAMIVEQASEEVMVTTTDGTIIYVNPAFERLTGYSREEAVGLRPNLLKSGVHDDEFYAEIWRCICDGHTWRGRLTNRRKDGALIELDTVISPVRSESGEIECYVAVKRDITGQARMEQELRQNQKMNAIGTLAGGIAHDFNNILGAIMGFAELLRDDLRDSDAGSKECLDSILQASDRARDLVRQILMFSRQSEQKMSVTAVDDIVRESLILIRSALPKHIEIEERIPSQKFLAQVDATQIHQVVMNLCTNAWHAMRESGGKLTVSLHRTEGYGESTPGRFLSLVVRDTGCGIDEAHREKIFDPFFTTKDRGDGTGMGLSVVHGIVMQHGGRITVRSKPGEGTEFEVLLPEAVDGEEAPQVEASKLPRGHEHILVIDDEPALLRVAERNLSALGYRVSTEISAQAALKRLADPAFDIDLVMTDMSMPKMSGVEVCARVREQRPALPVVLCTGYAGEVTETAGQSFDAVLLKPISRREAAETIRRVLEVARERR